MKVLITGITGFVGSHLADLLLEQGLEVYGTIRWRSRTDNIDHIKQHINLINGDIRDGYSMKQAVSEVKPDYLFHLAAQSFVAESWRAPHETLYTNIIGTLNVLEAVRSVDPGTIIVVAGSSEEYGYVNDDEVPIRETNPLRPASPYAIAKVASDLLARQYFSSYGMKAIVTRAFNTTGPRRGEVFVCSFYAKRLAEIIKGKRETVLPLGNMKAERDFTDVRDMVRAYWLIATKCKCGDVYNLCSGISRPVMEPVKTLVAMANVEVEYRRANILIRPSDIPRLQGNCDKFKAITGWKPTIPFDQTLRDLLDYWLERV